MSDTYIEESKKGWFSSGDAKPDVEHLILGCMQRIATATELACKDRERLEREVRHLTASRDRGLERERKLERRISTLLGVITKLKNKATRGGL